MPTLPYTATELETSSLLCELMPHLEDSSDDSDDETMDLLLMGIEPLVKRLRQDIGPRKALRVSPSASPVLYGSIVIHAELSPPCAHPSLHQHQYARPHAACQHILRLRSRTLHRCAFLDVQFTCELCEHNFLSSARQRRHRMAPY